MAAILNGSRKLDAKDRRILALVQEDGKLPQAEIARHIGLSTATVNERPKQPEGLGMIPRYPAFVDR